MLVTPIRRRNVSAEIVDQIMANIANGIWPAGSKLPSENELTQMFNVSRVPVREALQKLAALGIVQTRQGEGTFVLPVTPGALLNSLLPMLVLNRKNMMDILEYRKIAEADSAALAAANADAKDLARMEALVLEIERIRQPVAAFAVADMEFHLEVARATKNTLLFTVFNVVRDILVNYYRKINEIMGIDRAIKYHRLIFEAIRNRNQEEARRWMLEHIMTTIDDVSRSYADEE